MAVVINGNGNITGLDGVFSADSVNTLVDTRIDSDSFVEHSEFNTLLDARIDSADFVTLTGNQTVAGIKTFSDSAVFSGSFRQTGATAPFEWTVNPGAADYYKLNAVGYADNLIVANSAGNVGLGLNNPASNFHVYNSTDSEEQVIVAEVSGAYSNGAGVSLRRSGTEMGRVNADYFDGMTFHVTDGAGGAATQKARLATNGYFVIGENETPYNLFSVRDSDMGFEVNPNASKEVRLNAYDRGNSVFKTMALQADPVVIRPSGANGVGYTTIDNDGIKFNGDTAAANGLDDYEEGTWSPTLTNGTNSASAYTSQVGTYTKIGNLVYVHFDLEASNFGTFTSGSVYVGNLPFTQGNQYHQGVVDMYGMAQNAAGETCLQSLKNTDRIYILHALSTTGAHLALGKSYIDTGTRIRGALTYQV